MMKKIHNVEPGMRSGICSRQFISIFIVNIVFNLCQYMVNSVLSKYSDSLGFTTSQIGLIVSSFALAAFVFRFLAGPTIDSVNRKCVLICAMVLTAVSYLGFGISGGMYALIAFRLLHGVGAAFGNACCLAVIADILPKKQFTAGVGYFSCAMVAAQAIGPSFGLRLVEKLNYKHTFFINAGLLFLAAVFMMLVKFPRQETKRPQFHHKNIFAQEALLPALVLLFTSSGFAVIKSLLIVYAEKRSIGSEIGLFFTVYALTMLLTRPIVSKFIDQYGFVKVGIPLLFMTVVSLCMISMADRLWLFLAAAIIDAAGYGTVQPALQSLCLKSVPLERRGSASSTYFIGLDAATIIAPPLAGHLADTVGYSAMWRWISAPILIGICIVFFTRKKIKGIETDFLK